MRRRSILAAVGTGLTGASAGCLGRDDDPLGSEGASQATIRHGGRDRSYRIYRPQGLATPAPAVLVLHGGGGMPERVARNTGFDDLVGDDALVIYPAGVENHWNDGRESAPTTSHAETVDDVGFLSTLIDRLAAEGTVDPDRIAVTGASNGGMMTLRLCCAVPDRIAAAGVVIATLPAALFCPDPTPMPIVFLHGTADPLVPYRGGGVGFGRGDRGRRGEVLSVPETVRRWVRANGGTPETVPTVRRLDRRLDGTSVEVRRYEVDPSVVHYVVHGGGHNWATGSHGPLDLILGASSREIDGAEAVWEFLAAQIGVR